MHYILNQYQNMKKAELIKGIAAKAGITNKQAQDALEATLEIIRETVVAKNDRIVLPSFGIFCATERAARIGLNPLTKEKIDIPACKVAKFKPTKNAWF